MQKITKLVGISLLLSLVLGMSACNTVQGVGRDLRAGGDAINKAAQ